jgi:hypothetical protein
MKPRHFVRTFQPRFAALVESGVKRQTIRPQPKRIPRPGDTISLRAWKGRPYRSKQRILREATISNLEGITIHADGVEISPGTLRVFWMGEAGRRRPHLDAFARKDGFADWPDMKAWFLANHTLPFTGCLITWAA